MLQQFLRGQIGLDGFLAWIVAIAIAITVHEFAHGKRAEMAGDSTARQAGRLSLYPWVHFDPIGTTALLLFGFGWAKPVPVNPFAFRHPRRDEIMVSLWGPIANIITAAVFAIPLRFGFAGEYAKALDTVVYLNIILAVFNLIPVPPLDGSHVLAGLLPVQQARKLDLFFGRWGMLLLLGLIFTGMVGRIIMPPIMILHWVLTGLAYPILF